MSASPEQSPTLRPAGLSLRLELGALAVAVSVIPVALFRQWRVRSQQRASAEVTFRDGSSIQMRENTLVIIYGPSSRPTLQRVVTTSLDMIDDTDPAFYYGAGASIGLADLLALRIDARHVLAPASDAFAAHLFEISVGVSWRVVPVWP